VHSELSAARATLIQPKNRGCHAGSTSRRGLMAVAKKKGWFSKIESRDEALKMVKEASMAIFAIAALQAALSYFFGISLLVDAALYAIGGFFLRRFNSRAAASLLLALALVGAGVTVANQLGESLGGGNNILLALILVWVVFRAVDATFKLHGKFAVA
jgi:hypothetical protein